MEQVDLLRQVINVLEERQITYMVVGSYASGAYGEPRLTIDIDVVIDLRPAQVDALCGAFPGPEFYVSVDAARQAVREGGQFNVIHSKTGYKVDFLIAHKDPWGLSQLSRRKRVRILPDRDGFAAAPEDIIISKMMYYRQGGSEKHLRDITGMITVRAERLDRAYIERWAAVLDVMDIWQAVLRRLAKTIPDDPKPRC